METVPESRSVMHISLGDDFGRGFDFWVLRLGSRRCSCALVAGIRLLEMLMGGQPVGTHSSYPCSFGSLKLAGCQQVCRWLKESLQSENLSTSLRSF